MCKRNVFGGCLVLEMRGGELLAALDGRRQPGVVLGPKRGGHRRDQLLRLREELVEADEQLLQREGRLAAVGEVLADGGADGLGVVGHRSADRSLPARSSPDALDNASTIPSQDRAAYEVRVVGGGRGAVDAAGLLGEQRRVVVLRHLVPRLLRHLAQHNPLNVAGTQQNMPTICQNTAKFPQIAGNISYLPRHADDELHAGRPGHRRLAPRRAVGEHVELAAESTQRRRCEDTAQESTRVDCTSGCVLRTSCRT